MPRVFIALVPDEAFREKLVQIQQYWKINGVQGRYIPKENLHLTLAFIGSTERTEGLENILRQIRFSPFELEPEGCGSFEGVLWAGVRKNEALLNLVNELRIKLAEAGFPAEEREFVPHITLVRKPLLCGSLPDPEVRASMKVNAVSLMETVFHKDGVSYKKLCRAGGVPEDEK